MKISKWLTSLVMLVSMFVFTPVWADYDTGFVPTPSLELASINADPPMVPAAIVEDPAAAIGAGNVGWRSQSRYMYATNENRNFETAACAGCHGDTTPKRPPAKVPI